MILQLLFKFLVILKFKQKNNPMLVSSLKKCCLCIFFISCISAAQSNSASLIKKVDGFSHPESVVFDEVRNVVYVSNIGEDEPGDGFISKLSTDGEILDREWISGLNDPKGLLVFNDKLYVTDVTEVVKMDIKNSEIEKRISVEGSKFLNDITVASTGNIFISDSGKSSIYVMKKDSNEIVEWMDTKELEFPNGLLAQNGELYVSAWGSNDEVGNFLKIDMDTQEIEKISTAGIGNLDGVQATENGYFYISDWATGKIYNIDANGNIAEILTAEQSAGDILYLASENKLVLPMNFQNGVWWYQLE